VTRCGRRVSARGQQQRHERLVLLADCCESSGKKPAPARVTKAPAKPTARGDAAAKPAAAQSGRPMWFDGRFVGRFDIRRFGTAMAISNIVAAALLTLWPLHFRLDAASIARKWSRVEWVLLYHDRRGHFTIDRDLLLNLAMLLPLGLGFALARAARARRVFLEALLLGALVALCLEAAQLLTPHRVTQLADLWRNTLGCVVGAALGLALRSNSKDHGPSYALADRR
jgi:VanZ family protein